MGKNKEINIETDGAAALTVFQDLQLSQKKDYTESCSLSPRVKVTRKQSTRKEIANNILIKEYLRPHSESQAEYTLKRFAITPDTKLLGQKITPKQLHKVEQEIFQDALSELDSSPLVLADIFPRKDSEKSIIEKDLRSKFPEVHTVCLWKKDEKTIIVIDPTNSSFSDFLEPSIKKKGFKIEIHRHNNALKSFENDKFYFPSIIAPVGRNDGESRDCIDIAVKIACTINDVLNTAHYNSLKEAIEFLSKKFAITHPSIIELEKEINNLVFNNINELSNLVSINFNLGKANNGTLIRQIQSSDKPTMDKTKNLLILTKSKESSPEKSPTDYIAVNTFNELEELSQLFTKEEFIKLSRIIRSISSNGANPVLFSNLKSLKELEEQVVQLNKDHKFLLENIPALKAFPAFKLYISKQIEDVDFSRLTYNEDWSSLHLAIQTGDVLKIEYLMQQVFNSKDKTNSNQKSLAGICNSQGYTLLHTAIMCNRDINLIKYLLEKMRPEDISKVIPQQNNLTALHIAVMNDNLEVVQTLVETKISELINARDTQGQTAFHWALHYGHTKIAKILIDAMDPKYILEPAKGFNYTVLHSAVYNHNYSIVELLINSFKSQSGYNDFINATDANGYTALHWATLIGCKSSSELLIKQMDNLLCRDNLQQTVLHKAVLGHRVGVVKLLINENLGKEFINSVDSMGHTALHIAVRGHCKTMTKISEHLIKAGEISAQDLLNLVNNNNQTLLHIAAIGGNIDTIKLLIGINSDESFINAIDKNNQTALYSAVTHRCFEAIKLLIDHMTPESIINTIDFTIIPWARDNNVEIFEKLKEKMSISASLLNLFNEISNEDYAMYEERIANYVKQQPPHILQSIINNFPYSSIQDDITDNIKLQNDKVINQHDKYLSPTEILLSNESQNTPNLLERLEGQSLGIIPPIQDPLFTDYEGNSNIISYYNTLLDSTYNGQELN